MISSRYLFFLQNSCQGALLFHRKAALYTGPRMALGSLFFASEVLVAHPSEAEDHFAKLVEVHTVVLVGVQFLEDTVHCCLVIGFLQVRKV